MNDLEAIIAALEKQPPEVQQAIEQIAMEATADRCWVPNKGPQADAYRCKADILYYGGQAGGGKTDLIVGLSLTEHNRSLVLRRIKEDARELFDRYADVIGHEDGRNKQDSEWRLDGRLLRVRGCEMEADKQRFKGKPHDLIAFDEIPDFLESQFRFIIGWNRSARDSQRCRVVCTGNPPTTAEGLWVVRFWAAWLDPTHPKPAKPGELRWYVHHGDEDIEVKGPGEYHFDDEPKPLKALSRTFIPGALSDNPDLARTDYDAMLSSFPDELRRAYRYGDFTVGLSDQDFQVIPTEWILAAESRWTEHAPAGVAMTAMGFDPEGGGSDDGVLAAHYGGYFPELWIGSEAELIDGPSQAAFAMKHRKDAAPIGVDMGGGYGGRIQDAMSQNKIDVIPFIPGAKSTERTVDMGDGDGALEFYNKRAEALWRFREALDPTQEYGSCIALPPDSILRGDLTAATWKLNGRKIQIESKLDIKKRLGRSPDRGDAVMIAHWVQNIAHERFGVMGGRQPKVISGRRGGRVRMGRRK